MFQSWIVGLVLTFVVRQVAKFNENFDWHEFVADLNERVRKLVPGEMFDSYAVSLVEALLNGLRQVLASEDALAEIGKYAADGKWDEAINALKKLLLDVWDAQTPAELHVKRIVQNL